MRPSTPATSRLVGNRTSALPVSQAQKNSARLFDTDRKKNALSAEVKAGLAAKAGRGKILKVESLKKNEKLVAHEATVETGGRKSELQVGPGGKPLDHEE
jgi:hypothetical protein